MGDILNNLTPEELILIKERAASKREERHCLNCDKVYSMRKDQRFCCAACRTAFARHYAEVQHDLLIEEKRRWLIEREALIHEISELRRQLNQ